MSVLERFLCSNQRHTYGFVAAPFICHSFLLFVFIFYEGCYQALDCNPDKERGQKRIGQKMSSWDRDLFLSVAKQTKNRNGGTQREPVEIVV